MNPIDSAKMFVWKAHKKKRSMLPNANVC